MNNYAIKIDQLSVNYEKIPALWDVSVEIPKGTLTAIVGPNGAGKSTLLKAVMGLTPIFSGHIEVCEDNVAYIPQRSTVDWTFPITALELVLMGRYKQLGLFNRPKQADKLAALHYLEVVGLKTVAHRQIGELSGGQQQRAFFARALMQEANLYLFDEPFAGIDAATEELLLELMKKMQADGKTLVVVHHDLGTAGSAFDWLVLLNLRIIASGPTQEVFTKDILQKTYGKSSALFDQALKIAQSRLKGSKT